MHAHAWELSAVLCAAGSRRRCVLLATRLTLPLLAACPRRVARFYGQPRAERSATYARWWAAIKKEAKHYWVGGWVGGPPILDGRLPIHKQTLGATHPWIVLALAGHTANVPGQGQGSFSPQLQRLDQDCQALPPIDPTQLRTTPAVPPVQVGTKLLAADVKIASRLMGKVVHGKTLTRWVGCPASFFLQSLPRLGCRTCTPRPVGCTLPQGWEGIMCCGVCLPSAARRP